MKLSVYIRLWGGLDVGYVLWRVFFDLNESKIPFFGLILEPWNAAREFGQTPILILTLAASLIALTIILSGPLMLLLNRVGVYVSLVQLPFRLTLLVPPTFFFIQSAREYFHSLLLIMVILALEVFKAATEILWLKERHKRA